MKLAADCVTFQTKDDVAILGFADDALNTAQYVLIQRSLRPSPTDAQLGFDRPYIEVNEQAHSGYVEVSKATLQASGVVLKLATATALKMGIDDTIEITLRAPAESTRQLADQLRLVLGDERVKVETTQ